MIPLHISSTSDQSRLFNNPIYYIRNAVGPVAGDYNLIVINTPMDTGWESWGDIIPTDYNPLGPSNWGTFINADTESDVEFITVTNAYDQQVEPNPDRDGSLAGIPQKRHKIISISGFVRGRSQNYTIGVSEFYNMSFNPVLSYLEGSSTFQHSLFPNWQPFYNVGYNVLAWYDPSFRGDFRKVSAAEGGSVDPWSVDPYARLNRMIFVRPLSRPVLTRSKFEDFNTAFRIELLATDPTIYEFIPPELWFADGETTPLFIDSVQSEGNETLVIPEYPWGFSGPGWREVSIPMAYYLGAACSNSGSNLASDYAPWAGDNEERVEITIARDAPVGSTIIVVAAWNQTFAFPEQVYDEQGNTWVKDAEYENTGSSIDDTVQIWRCNVTNALSAGDYIRLGFNLGSSLNVSSEADGRCLGAYVYPVTLGSPSVGTGAGSFSGSAAISTPAGDIVIAGLSLGSASGSGEVTEDPGWNPMVPATDTVTGAGSEGKTILAQQINDASASTWTIPISQSRDWAAIAVGYTES